MISAALSTANPLVEPAAFAGTRTLCVATAGGHAGPPVTSTDMTHPNVEHVEVGKGGFVLVAKVPMLKKIQSLGTPVPPPLGL